MNAAEKGRDYLKKGKFREAMVKFQAWTKKYPDDYTAWLDLGACLYHVGNLEQALLATRKSLELKPEWSLAINNIGLYYQMRNDGKTASSWYSKAAEKGYVDANFNLALMRLRGLMDNLSFEQEWDECWDLYDWRFKKQSPVPLPKVPDKMKFWDGKSPVMALTEQGVGDTIMFSRYVDLLPEGSIFAVPAELACIFEGKGYKMVHDTLEHGDVVQWCPMAELAKRFKCIPAGPQIREGGTKVGVCWQGNKEHGNDKNRSYPELKNEMLALPNAISLQFGHNTNIKNWQDTLDLLKDCHTVVTVDTSLAHLAGYLGIRCLVIMPRFDWDFRWGTGKTNHWYPSITAYSSWKELLADL